MKLPLQEMSPLDQQIDKDLRRHAVTQVTQVLERVASLSTNEDMIVSIMMAVFEATSSYVAAAVAGRIGMPYELYQKDPYRLTLQILTTMREEHQRKRR